jgi:hypothetical protein
LAISIEKKDNLSKTQHERVELKPKGKVKPTEAGRAGPQKNILGRAKASFAPDRRLLFSVRGGYLMNTQRNGFWRAARSADVERSELTPEVGQIPIHSETQEEIPQC